MTTSSGKAATGKRTTKRVGDTHELKGHGIVVFPDGSAATASRSLILTQPGAYKVTYNDKAHKDESFTVTKAVNPRLTPDGE